MSEESYIVNEGKNEIIEVDGVKYQRLAIRTHVITDKDDVCDVIEKYAKPYAKPDDIVFMTEKAVACTQRRAIPMKDIHPRPLAKFLCKFVLKTPYGIGLGIPETMEMALQECGTPRILFAAAVSAVGKLFHKRGWFYKIAGYKARSIDGPCDYTRLHTTTMLYWVQQNRTKPHRKCPSVWAASRLLSPTSTTWKVRFLVSPTARWTATCWSKS